MVVNAQRQLGEFAQMLGCNGTTLFSGIMLFEGFVCIGCAMFSLMPRLLTGQSDTTKTVIYQDIPCGLSGCTSWRSFVSIPLFGDKSYTGGVESDVRAARNSAAAQMLRDEVVHDKFQEMKDDEKSVDRSFTRLGHASAAN
eukprot:s1782_g6.t1